MNVLDPVAIGLAAVWLGLVWIWFRKSTLVLLGGLSGLAALGFAGCASGLTRYGDVGLTTPASWPLTVVVAAAWAGVMFAYSPIADWLASRWFRKPPTLGAFGAIQQSRLKLLLGIVVAWLLGGVLEEFVFRGLLLGAMERGLEGFAPPALAAALALMAAALGAGVLHLYQGARAAVIVGQLSVLFGVLYVVTDHNLWAVMLAHGFYDTVAFIRFGAKKSKYSNLDGGPAQT